VPARGDDERLSLYVQLPEACTNLTEPTGLFAGGAYAERWSIRSPNGLTGKPIRILGLASAVTDVLVRPEQLDGASQIIQLTASNPSFVVQAAPGLWQVAATYMKIGALGPGHAFALLAARHVSFGILQRCLGGSSTFRGGLQGGSHGAKESAHLRDVWHHLTVIHRGF
jgi:hypothetical protein